jgi:hypothetical protein
MGKRLEVKEGDRYNMWTIINEVKPHIYPSGRPRRKFKCICDCGNIKENTINVIKNNYSCGCYHSINLSKRNKTHGLSYHPLFKTWCDMRKRCRAKQGTKDWEWYGKYGVVVCDRWLGRDGFKNFLEDMGEKPGPEYSIDRINVYGNYEPSNCRWATPEEQANNKRKKEHMNSA